MKIYLIDQNSKLVDCWKQEFENLDDVVPMCGDYFSQRADAVVSPANSHGIMDGGIDKRIRDYFGPELEKVIQKKIELNYHGEMPVGVADFVFLSNAKFQSVIFAPTMRSPEDVSNTLNAYVVFRAILLHAIKNELESFVCCGLCTGIGKMTPEDCARQMRMAYDQVMGSPKLPSYLTLKQNTMKLRGLL